MKERKKDQSLTKKECFETIIKSYNELLIPHEDWSNSGGIIANQDAQNALITFYEDYSHRSFDLDFNLGNWGMYYSFLDRLCIIRNALRKKNYQAVCQELVSFMHYEMIFQSRIHSSLIYLLKTELMEE